MAAPDDTRPLPPAESDTHTVVEMPAEPVGAIAIGSRLGRYVVVEPIGEGAMGRVLRAYDAKLRRELALKLLRTRGNDEARARMVREAQAMAQLSHPNIVAVFDVDVHDGQPFIAMEYVEGVTLGAWFTQRPRGWREVVAVFLAAGRGLAAAHAAGIVHRDFKPGNVLISTDAEGEERVRVSDFGLARNPGMTASGGEEPDLDVRSSSGALEVLTSAGMVVGTPAYMAPEQHLGGAIDARSDQYSFCVALWEGLTGRRLFTGKDVPAKLSRATLERADARMIPAHLRAVLRRGLAPEPTDRFASMIELLEALARDPARRRTAVAAAVVLVGGLGVWMLSERQAEHAFMSGCADAGRSIAALWDDAARSRVQEGLRASAVVYADATYERVVPWIDAWTDAWAQAREQTCLARAPRETATVACLELQRTELRALLDTLADADAEVVRRAVASAAALPAVARCSDERVAAVPADVDAAAFAAASERLATARALVQLGRTEEAAALLDEVATDDPLLAARTRLIAGEIAHEQARYDDARAELEAAFLAASAAGADDVAGSAALLLTTLVGSRLADVSAGRLWGRLAQVEVERQGGGDDLAMATLHAARGRVDRAQGEPAAARDEHARALAIREQRLGEDHPDVAVSLVELGDAEVALRDFPAALPHYERALAIQRRTLGEEHPDVGHTLAGLGLFHARRGDAAQGVEHLERALALLERASGPDHPEVASTLINLGHAYMFAQSYEQARACYERALVILELAFGSDHADVALVLLSLGTLEHALGNLDVAEPHLRRALAIQERRLGPDHPEVGGALIGLGAVASGRGQQAAAREATERGLAIMERKLGVDHPDLVVPLVNLGEIAVIEHDWEGAVALFERALVLEERARGSGSAEAEALRDSLTKARAQR